MSATHEHGPDCAHCGASPSAGGCRCHGGGGGERIPGATTVALIGSPNAGKTSVFNGLTGLRLKTGNYPGVTVTRSVGRVKVPTPAGSSTRGSSSAGSSTAVKSSRRSRHRYVNFEDLPGAYSLDPISPDEQVVADLLAGRLAGAEPPEAALVVIDATVLQRSLALVAETLNLDIPVAVVLTMTDEMDARGGTVDVDALSEALGVPVVTVIGTRKSTLEPVRELLADPHSWSRPVVPPPAEPGPERSDWAESVITAAGYQAPRPHSTTAAIDRILLHPAFGMLVFLLVMFVFFQVIFTVAAPLQDGIETFFGWLGELTTEYVTQPVLGDFISTTLLGGVGGVLVFVPQIMLMFLLISLMENVGYMSRTAFLTDKVMSRAGLEGRAFVAMLSSFACAVPGIMATRTIPSSKDRIATIMTAPLMTCSARIPVYVLLVGLLIPNDSRFGPLHTQGLVVFGLYVLGAVSAMVAAAIFKKTKRLRSGLMPFYMEMPPYRLPSLKSVIVMMWDSTWMFLRKVGGIILTTAIVLWLLMSLPARTEAAEQIRTDTISAELAAGASQEDAEAAGDAESRSYVLDNSAAASIGKFIEPVFAPLGFDWRIDIGILGSFAAREVVVSTMGQIAAAEDPDDPSGALAEMTYTSGDREGEKVFSTPTIVAMLLFFVYALQCASTIGAIRRETNSWRWPIIAWVYMFGLAWIAAYIGHTVAAALT